MPIAKTKSPTKNYFIKTTYIVYASPAKVFEALTDSGIIFAWGGGLAVVENKTGGKFELFDGWVKGEVVTYKPAKELSYTWKPDDWNAKVSPSLVVYKLKEHPAGTEVILEHTALPSQEEADKHAGGWLDYVFEPLNEYFTR